MERRSHSPHAVNPLSDARAVRRSRSLSLNSNSSPAANLGSNPQAVVSGSGSRNSIEAGETFDEEALTDDNEVGEVVQKVCSPAAVNSLLEPREDVGSQNSINSDPTDGDPLSDTPMAKSVSEPPAYVSRTRSLNSSSGTTMKTLDGQNSDGGERVIGAGEILVEAQDEDAVAEGEVGDLKHASPPSASAASRQIRARGPSRNETRWKTFTVKPPSRDMEEELESENVQPTGEAHPDRMVLEGLPDSAEFFAGLQGGSAATSTQVMVEDVEDFEDGQRLNSSENQDLENGNNMVLGAELHPAPDDDADHEGTEEDLANSNEEEDVAPSLEENYSGSPGVSAELSNAGSLRLGGGVGVSLAAVGKPLEVEETSDPKSAASQGDEGNGASKVDQELAHDEEV